jgi:hypothetical protein
VDPVVEHLLNKHKALISNPSTLKKRVKLSTQIIFLLKKVKIGSVWGWGYGSVVQLLPSMC